MKTKILTGLAIMALGAGLAFGDVMCKGDEQR
ncbi:hypothetical protein C826_01497 [Helicobacter bilis WiWa]|uniref:Uncharacterized protein n=1 Tax=Helicobacter bilis WiWa TaxID=1235804 RepID=N2BDJ2_9HELI|nr:hypothetical protein C826_01497 [Helicobacter bilis WiWa]